MDFTRYLNQHGRAGRQVNEEIYRMAYEELRLMAQAKLRAPHGRHTLTPTGLVHDAFLRMVNQTKVTWQGKRHFMSIASHAMRRIIINHARDKKALKRGGGAPVVSLKAALALPAEAPVDVMLALEEALGQLEVFDPLKAKIIEMRYFAGFTEQEVADLLEVSKPTVQRHWYAARAWLYKELKPLFPDRQGNANDGKPVA